MKKWIVIGILPILVIGMVLMSGCTGTEPNTGPTPSPSLTTIQTPSTQDPIIGSWLNGMVFNADGTVGSNGTTTWKVNANKNNSYFTIVDVPSGGAQNSRNVSSTEWIYNPATDKINIWDSSESFPRGIPTTQQVVNGTVSVTPTRDPILGPWRNGMFFYANGTLDGNGTTTWKVNKNENNSYFIISDVPSEGANNIRKVSSTEWKYNPASDKINMRGSSESFSRGIPTPKPTPLPSLTTMQTPSPAFTTIPTPTPAVPLANDKGTGSLFIHTGGLGNDITVYIARDDGTNIPPIIIGGLNPEYTQVKILPDGCSERVSLTPGKYIAYLPDKSGDQAEQQSFVINANYNTDISFIGLSYRSSGGGGCGG
jgi:hypothetical protein